MSNSYSKFLALKDAKGVTAYRVAAETQMSQCVFSTWKKRGFTPKYEKLKRIADYFGVTVDYFYGNEE